MENITATEAHRLAAMRLTRLTKYKRVRYVTSTQVFKEEPIPDELIYLASFDSGRGLKGLTLSVAGTGLSVILSKDQAVEVVVPRVLSDPRVMNDLYGLMFVVSELVGAFSGKGLTKMVSGDIVQQVKDAVLTDIKTFGSMGSILYLEGSDVADGYHHGGGYASMLWAKEFLSGLSSAQNRLRKSNDVQWFLAVGDTIVIAFKSNGDPMVLIVPIGLEDKRLPAIVGPQINEVLPLLAPTRMSEFLSFAVTGRVDRLVSALSFAYK